MKSWNTRNKKLIEADKLIMSSKDFARKRIKQAKLGGKLNWKGLPKILTVSQTKIDKSIKIGYLTAAVQLASSWISGYNTCSHATSCAEFCITFTGRGEKHMLKKGRHYVLEARIIRTLLLKEHPEEFFKQLNKELGAFLKKSKKLNLIPACRLNTTSDEQWEKPKTKWIFFEYPEIMFYDYTKKPNRNVTDIPNYHLVFSLSEDNEDIAFQQNKNVAIVFDTTDQSKMPKRYKGWKVVNGDKHD